MIDQKKSTEIGNALSTFVRNHEDRVRIRQSGNDGEFWSACTENAEVENSIVCPVQQDKTKNCGTCGLCWTTKLPIKFLGHSRSLKSDHAAIQNATTVYMNSKLTNLDPMEEKSVLKKSSNKKLGTRIVKGIWKNHNILTLTLTERETCPMSCKHWNDCYGNNLHLAKRISTDGLMEKIEADLEALNPKKSYAIRLHVLGDFYSVEYVEFWNRMFDKFDNIKIFGYTAHEIDNTHMTVVENRKVA